MTEEEAYFRVLHDLERAYGRPPGGSSSFESVPYDQQSTQLLTNPRVHRAPSLLDPVEETERHVDLHPSFMKSQEEAVLPSEWHKRLLRGHGGKPERFERQIGEQSLQYVYQELSELHQLLQSKSASLQRDIAQFEARKGQAEQSLRGAQAALESEKRAFEARVDSEVERRLQIELSATQKVKDAKERLSKEVARLQQGFAQSQGRVARLTKQLAETTAALKSTKAAHDHAKGRLKNLQRLKEQWQRHAQEKSGDVPERAVSKKVLSSSTGSTGPSRDVKRANSSAASAAMAELSHSLLELVAAGLRRDVWARSFNKEQRQRQVESLLPQLVSALPSITNAGCRLQETSLRIALWCLLHRDATKRSLASTLRRLGEQLYQPTFAPTASTPRIYYRSNNTTHRMLSCLVILQTDCQGAVPGLDVFSSLDEPVVDHVLHVVDSLKSDLLKSDGKALFLQSHGLEVVQSLLKSPSHPVRLCSADLVLAVTMDANTSDEFLVELCKPAWARLLKSLLAEYITKARQLDGSSTHDVALIEKLSVIVQKLSKQRNARSVFETSGLHHTLTDLLDVFGKDHTFVALNIRSALSNIADEEE